jgi:hypothetical protein
MLDKQLKGIVTVVKQQGQNLHEQFSTEPQVTQRSEEATQQEFKTQLVLVEA